MNDGPDYYDYDHCAVDDMVLEAAGASTALATPAAAAVAAADGQINPDRSTPHHSTRNNTQSTHPFENENTERTTRSGARGRER